MGRSVSAEEILSMCKRGSVEEFKGIIETVEFEFKQSPYRLEEEHQKRELAKDISGLANAGGGLILLGAKAAPPDPLPHHGEEIDEITHFSTLLFDWKQYRDTLRAWVYPDIKGVRFQLHRCPTRPDYCVVTISVPKCDPSTWPLLVRRPAVSEGKASGTMFGYFERLDADVEPTSIERIHALLRTGIDAEPIRNRLGGIENILSELLDRSEQIGRFAEDQNRRRAQRHKQLHQLSMKSVFDREMSEALTNSGLQDEPHIMLAVYPPGGVDLSNLLDDGDKGIPEPPKLRAGGFDLSMRDFWAFPTRDTRRFVRAGYKLREVSRFGLIVAIH